MDRDKWIVNQMELQDKLIPDYKNTLSALDKQIGGNHYKDCKIQPVEFIAKNKIGFLEGNIIKYATRHSKKGEGKKDIEKVIHYAELILEMYYNDN
tara:strand:+ start:4382 stop:4669 length:288 start_codon:yes stop_codon:yes gene_type:complete